MSLNHIGASCTRVATAPTVYGIETATEYFSISYSHLVATAPTVYGIETYNKPHRKIFVVPPIVATAPTVYGIETSQFIILSFLDFHRLVATAPTIYGIETYSNGLPLRH